MSEITDIQAELELFTARREWHKYHTLPNLAKSISIESAELLQNFQWEDPSNKTGYHDRFAEEIADIMIYCLMFCTNAGINPIDAIWEKIASNGQRYPIEKCKGNCKKAEEL